MKEEAAGDEARRSLKSETDTPSINGAHEGKPLLRFFIFQIPSKAKAPRILLGQSVVRGYFPHFPQKTKSLKVTALPICCLGMG